MTASAISLDVAEVQALLARIAPLITKADHECLTSLVGTLLEVLPLTLPDGLEILHDDGHSEVGARALQGGMGICTFER